MMNDEKISGKSIPLFGNSWEDMENTIWLVTAMELHRNIEKFHFPKHLSDEKQKSVCELVLKSLEGTSFRETMDLYESVLLTPLDKDFFSEHFMLQDHSQELYRQQTYLIQKSGGLGVILNGQDHIEIVGITNDNHLEGCFESLLQFEQIVEKQLPYAFSNQFGFLTADSRFCGTGFLIRAYFHVPGLVFTKAIEQYISPNVQEDVKYHSLYDDAEHLPGDILVVTNRYVAGVSEEAIISSVRNAGLRIVHEEQKARKALLEAKDSSMLKEISRAVGNAQYGYMIDTQDALHTLSMCKLGLEESLLTGIDPKKVTQMLFNIRRGHLLKMMGKGPLSNEEIYRLRAKYIKEMAKDLCVAY